MVSPSSSELTYSLSLSLFLSLISSFTLILSLWHWTESFIMLEHLRNRASCKFFFQLSACKFNGRSMSCLLLAIARVQKPTTWGPWHFFLMPSSEFWTLLLDSHIEYCCNCYYYPCLLIRFIVITSTISIIIIVIYCYLYIYKWFCDFDFDDHCYNIHVNMWYQSMVDLWFLIPFVARKKPNEPEKTLAFPRTIQ